MTLDDVRRLAATVRDALRDAGEPADADLLTDALATDASDAESLLVLRSALVSTRPRWEALSDAALAATARAALAAAKRLAIEL